jgi:hypothetical protein
MGVVAKAVQILVLQGARIGQHFERKRDALHLGIEHDLDAFHRLQHAVEGCRPVAHMLDVDQARREQDER